MNHASLYCKTLARVTKAELVNALHQAMLQLRANGMRVEQDGRTLDNAPAIKEAARLMEKAGHIGFTSAAHVKPTVYRLRRFVKHRVVNSQIFSTVEAADKAGREWAEQDGHNTYALSETKSPRC